MPRVNYKALNLDCGFLDTPCIKIIEESLTRMQCAHLTVFNTFLDLSS